LRYFDVAPLYGWALRSIGSARACGTSTGAPVVLSTKVGRLLDPQPGGPAAGASAGAYPFSFHYDYSYDATMRSLEHSLQRIGTNAIDIALIHDVNRRWQGDLLEQRYAEAMSGAYRACMSLRAAGSVKAIGVGVNDWSILERFREGRRLRLLHARRAATRFSTIRRSTLSCRIARDAASAS
jgi:D-threo-aldose 1-dehydrogenase